MTRRVRRYWDEEDIWYYFELDAEGWVTRHIEVQQPDGTPLVAASLREWFRELEAGRIGQYLTRYGHLAEKPIEDDEIEDYEPVSEDDFERLWASARRHLESQPSA
ncbi:MAG: hypothetical protein ABW215_18735 [Kibdelosporangium sp.]